MFPPCLPYKPIKANRLEATLLQVTATYHIYTFMFVCGTSLHIINERRRSANEKRIWIGEATIPWAFGCEWRMRFEPRRELRRFSASIASLLLHRSPPWLSLRWSECEKECVNEFWSLNWISIVAFWFWIWAGVGVLVDLGLSHYRPLRLTYRVMLGAPALLLVHPAIVFNSLNAPGVFFLLKLVAVLFFLLRLHCFFLHFLPLLLVRAVN